MRQIGKDEFRQADRERLRGSEKDVVPRSAGLGKVEGRSKAFQDLDLQHGELRLIKIARLTRSKAQVRASVRTDASRTRSATRNGNSPCCRVPRTSPGPRISKSSSAIWKPSAIFSRAVRRRKASGESESENKKQ